MHTFCLQISSNTQLSSNCTVTQSGATGIGLQQNLNVNVNSPTVSSTVDGSTNMVDGNGCDNTKENNERVLQSELEIEGAEKQSDEICVDSCEVEGKAVSVSASQGQGHNVNVADHTESSDQEAKNENAVSRGKKRKRGIQIQTVNMLKTKAVPGTYFYLFYSSNM